MNERKNGSNFLIPFTFSLELDQKLELEIECSIEFSILKCHLGESGHFCD